MLPAPIASPLVGSYPVRYDGETELPVSSRFVPPGTTRADRPEGAGAFWAHRTDEALPRASVKRASVLAGRSDVSCGVRLSVPP